jgi:hypothetical protein
MAGGGPDLADPGVAFVELPVEALAPLAGVGFVAGGRAATLCCEQPPRAKQNSASSHTVTEMQD